MFDKLVEALAYGAGSERIADASWGATTMPRRSDEWIRLGARKGIGLREVARGSGATRT